VLRQGVEETPLASPLVTALALVQQLVTGVPALKRKPGLMLGLQALQLRAG
jgi:hypothetical protein